MKLVFVSSTFKDMQFERDALNTYVAPLIDAQLASHGEQVYFGDLRWGVNTTELDSEESSRKVLDVCLDEIDNCKPYMIVLIGERYGWIPEAELLRSASVAKGIDAPDDISVTQLEIEYGALLNPDYEGRILFYFRNLDKTEMSAADRRDYEAESELHREKLAALRLRIAAAYPDSIRYYDARWNGEKRSVEGLMPLMDVIREDLCRIFLSDIASENNVPWQQRAMNSAHRYYMGHSRHYVDVTIGEREPLSGIYSDTYQLVSFVEGAQGSGKTAFISDQYRGFYELDDEKLMVPFVKGLDTYSIQGENFFKVLLYSIEEKLGEEHTQTDYTDGEDNRPYICNRIKNLLSELSCPVIAVVDNCDYDLYYDLWVGFYQGLPSTAEEYIATESVIDRLFLVVAYSSLEPRPAILAPNYNFASTFIMKPLYDEEKREFIKTVVKGRHKELSDVVVERIIVKRESHLPLYVKLVIDRLLLLDSEDFAKIRALGDGMENINNYMISLVDNMADDLESITVELVKEAAERTDRDFVYRLLGLLSYFPIWLTEGFVKQFFVGCGWKFNALDFSITVKMLSTFVSYNTETTGYSITNQRMLSAIRAHLVNEGYGDTPCRVFDYITDESNGTDLGKYAIKVASLLPTHDTLVRLFIEYYYADEDEASTYDFLYYQFEWLVKNMEDCAGFVRDLVNADTKADFSFLIRRLPVKSQIQGECAVISGFLVDVCECLPISKQNKTDAGYSSFALLVRLRLIEDVLQTDAATAIGIWVDEIQPYVYDCYLYGETIAQYNLTAIHINTAARSLGFVKEAMHGTDSPLDKFELTDSAYDNSVFAGHVLYATACDIRDDDEERYNELVVDAVIRYSRLNLLDENERKEVVPDDLLTISEAFGDAVKYFVSCEDYDNARAVIDKFIEVTRLSIFFFGSRMVRLLRSLLYMIDIGVADADDETPLRILASVSRMISYRTRLVPDRDMTIFVHAKLLRIYDMIYEIGDGDDVFEEILTATVYEIEEFVGNVSGSTLRLSVLLDRFFDVLTCLKFLNMFDREEDISDIISAILSIELDEEDKEGSIFSAFCLVSRFFVCSYGDCTEEDVSLLKSLLEELQGNEEHASALVRYSEMITYISEALE